MREIKSDFRSYAVSFKELVDALKLKGKIISVYGRKDTEEIEINIKEE